MAEGSVVRERRALRIARQARRTHAPQPVGVPATPPPPRRRRRARLVGLAMAVMLVAGAVAFHSRSAAPPPVTVTAAVTGPSRTLPAGFLGFNCSSLIDNS